MIRNLFSNHNIIIMILWLRLVITMFCLFSAVVQRRLLSIAIVQIKTVTNQKFSVLSGWYEASHIAGMSLRNALVVITSFIIVYFKHLSRAARLM